MLQRLDRARGEHGAQREAQVRRTPHLGHRGGNGERQALSAIFLGTRQAAPAAGHIGLIGIAKPRRRAHGAILEPCPLAIATVVDRREHVACEVGGLLEHRRHGVGCGNLIAGQGCNRGKASDLFEHEAHVTDGRRIRDHLCFLPVFNGALSVRHRPVWRSGRARPAPWPGAR